MTKIAINLNFKQIQSALKQLDEEERWRLTKQLVKDEMTRVVKKLRQNIRRQNLSPQEIDRIIEKARQEYYAQSRS